MSERGVRVARIEAMEARLHKALAAVKALERALDDYDGAREALEALESYYAGPDWREDFEADEAGLLPEGLKRGVLSEDALYDLLAENNALLRRLGEL